MVGDYTGKIQKLELPDFRHPFIEIKFFPEKSPGL